MHSVIKLDIIPNLSALNLAINKINKQTLGLGDTLTTPIKQAKQALKNLSKEVNPVYGPKFSKKTLLDLKKQVSNATATKLKLDVSEACKKLDDMKLQIAGTIGSVWAISKPISKALSFEGSFAMVKKVVDLSQEESASLQKQIFALARLVPLSAKELTEIMASGGQLGLEKNLLMPFTDVVSKMAFAFDISSQEAGESIAGIMQKLGVGIDEVKELGDAINTLGNSTAAAPKEITQILSRTAGLIKTLGLSAREGVAISASFANMKIGAEQAATAINKMLNTLGSSSALTDRAKDALSQLGIDTEDLKEAMQNSPMHAIRQVLGSIAEAEDGEKIGILKNLFGEEAAPKIAQITSNLAKFDEIVKKTMDTKHQTGSMEKEVETLANTTQGAMKRMQSSLNALSISLGNALLPLVNSVFNGISEIASSLALFSQRHQGLIKALGITTLGILGLKVVSFLPAAFRAISSCLLLPIKLIGIFCNKAQMTKVGLMALKSPITLAKTSFSLLTAPINLTGSALFALIPKFGKTRFEALKTSSLLASLRGSLLKIPLAAKIASVGVAKFGFAFKATAKIIKSALISTGIGAFYIALGEAFAYVSENWEKILAWMEIGIEKISSMLSPLFDFFSKAFTTLSAPITSLLEKLGGLRKQFSLPSPIKVQSIPISQGQALQKALQAPPLVMPNLTPTTHVMAQQESRRDAFPTKGEGWNTTGLIDALKEAQAKNIENKGFSEKQSTQKSIVDNRSFVFNTTTNPREIESLLRSNRYTYADLEDEN
ncbi:phage tail tape measure protein [Helicobacter mustelae]|uniref:Putative phage tape-measure protein n=1 Tax=Helicobacter mustelae (strain ATCC 43772 / CCUG 25715 / CIP 103759 / LMG 18044 / NCTC 12198 / R85-136P) TaxID=679897 RepID=D3UG43_HELM1|nr:phage tail tape measure protein [Helicobacter mustelae]CBG39464.1 putative phage tape-measure protein [Helicobacter mustelae 12198]SQH70976.1 phage tape-measure protein [Helicobacter mustelae]